jgi:hypothetical protein
MREFLGSQSTADIRQNLSERTRASSALGKLKKREGIIIFAEERK